MKQPPTTEQPPTHPSSPRTRYLAARRSSRRGCCGLLWCVWINHPQERAVLMGECWSQRETAVSAGSPQSPLFHPSPRAQTQACCDTSAAGEERV